ncbi:uncharacterized protein LOC144909705 [Branchiostoma floridae x Branchiostoma belcheri]
MGKLTANTGGKAKEAEPAMAEEPVPEKPDPSPPSFVVSPPVYCPPSTSPGRLTRKRKQCLGRCKVLVCCVLAILGVFIFMGASWYVHKMHREAEKPPCVYGDEHEDCDREKSERWQEWLEKSLWVMQHKGEGRRDGHRMMGPEHGREPPHLRMDELRQMMGEMEERYQEMRDRVHPPAPPPSPPPPPM